MDNSLIGKLCAPCLYIVHTLCSSTSEEWTTSKQRTKCSSPMCPLFEDSTVDKLACKYHWPHLSLLFQPHHLVCIRLTSQPLSFSLGISLGTARQNQSWHSKTESVLAQQDRISLGTARQNQSWHSKTESVLAQQDRISLGTARQNQSWHSKICHVSSKDPRHKGLAPPTALCPYIHGLCPLSAA